ncbi:hypothetical protein GCM10022254_34470 [Actinomadura meridiana]|uniref:Uncharacterized protein n=1 Tax=Actinomadura meridiana TaxID=559626 RepID=A0ABP8C3J3_9ACTN
MGVVPHKGTGRRTNVRGKDEALAPESLNGLPVVVVTLWVLCAAGWGAVLAGLRNGVHGRARGPSLFAHTITFPGVVLTFSLIGFGSLYATIALTAEWWALLLVTGFRPERLLSTGGLGRLAAWAALTAAVTYATARLVFRV